MKYSYVALSAAALATGASAVPLGFFGKQSSTMNENAGIMDVDRRDYNSGFGNDIKDGSNADFNGATITLKRDTNSGFGNDISDGSNVDFKDAVITLKRSPLGFFGQQSQKVNENAGIMDVERRSDTNSGFGNDISEGSNADFNGAVITLKRDTNSGFGNDIKDGSNADFNGATITLKRDTNSGFGNDISDASNADFDGATITLKRDTNSGFGNDVSDASNVDFKDAVITLKRSPLGFFGQQSQKVNENAGIMDVERRSDTNSGFGNDISEGSNADFNGATITLKRDTNSGFGNDIKDGSNADFNGATITLKRSPLLSFDVGTHQTTQNENGGIADVTPEAMMQMKSQKSRRDTNSGFGNDVSDASNVDFKDAIITLKRSPLISFGAGSTSTTQNENGGISDVTPEALMQMKSQQRRSDTNSGFGNDIKDGSNADFNGATITLKRSPLISVNAGSTHSTGNANGGISDVTPEALMQMKSQQRRSDTNSGFGNDIKDGSNADFNGATITLKRDTNIGFANDLRDGSDENFSGAHIDISNQDLLG